MYCKKCGAKLNDESRFCHKCGCKVIINIDADINVNATLINNKSINNTSDIDVSNENIHYSTVNNYTTENHFEHKNPNIIETVGRTANKTHNAIKKPAIIALMMALIIMAASLYLEYFVSGPEATINKMMDSMSEMDINTAITCFCPKVVAEYKGMMGLTDTIMGFAGIGTNMEAIAGLAPLLLGSEYDIPKFSCDVVNIEYSGGAYETFPIEIEGIAKILASDAMVTIDEYEDGEPTGTETIHLKRYGSDGWLIEDDLFK